MTKENKEYDDKKKEETDERIGKTIDNKSFLSDSFS